MSPMCGYRAVVLESARPFSIEAAADVAAARIELRRYRLPNPSEMWELDAAPIFSAVDPRPRGAEGEVRYGEGAARSHTLGRLMLRPAGVPMHSRGQGGAMGIMTCRFDPGFFVRATGLDDWDRERLDRCAAIRSGGAEQAAARLRREVQAPGFAATLAIEASVQLLAVEIGRFFRPAARTPATRLAPWQLRRIDEALRDADGDWPDTARLAALCGISRSHLSRGFAATTGTTLVGHATAVRIAQAKALLADRALPLDTIAARLGFASQSAFGVAFRRATGATPAGWRRGG